MNIERPETCRREQINTCDGCSVTDIVISKLTRAKSSDIPHTIMTEIADEHCPEGLGPNGIVLNPIIISGNGQSEANTAVSER